MSNNIKVKITILAQGAYASIQNANEQSPFIGLDVLLPAGKGASAGLSERAKEYQAKAERYARYAQLCEQAAKLTIGNPNHGTR